MTMTSFSLIETKNWSLEAMSLLVKSKLFPYSQLVAACHLTLNLVNSRHDALTMGIQAFYRIGLGLNELSHDQCYKQMHQSSQTLGRLVEYCTFSPPG